jgi:hypothetical protein
MRLDELVTIISVGHVPFNVRQVPWEHRLLFVPVHESGKVEDYLPCIDACMCIIEFHA